MELIAISDIYGNPKIVGELASRLDNKLREERIIVIAGDVANKLGSATYQKDVNEIFSVLREHAAHVLFIPGDTDDEDLRTGFDNVISLDRSSFSVEIGGVRLGFIGFGGAPRQSLRENEPTSYVWDEEIIEQGIIVDLKIALEKASLPPTPDYIILVTHSPPYGIADYSTPITMREMLVVEEVNEELLQLISAPKEEKASETKRPSRSPRRLGSHVIKKFADYYKPDIHLFGHVHKQGGKFQINEATQFLNTSHLSSVPYKLTGRKYLRLEITRDKVSHSFDSVVSKDLSFADFVETYL
jgi:Icc-related predicted phosphoesterase